MEHSTIHIVSRYIVAALLLASCQAVDPAPAARAPHEAATDPGPAARATEDAAAEIRLTAEGWGPLRVGMTREEIVAAVGDDSHPESVGGSEPERCDQFYPSGAPAGMMVMVEEGRLTRITLTRQADVQTEHGFGVGDLASSIKLELGSSAVASPHKYLSAPAQYVTVWKTAPSEPDPRGIVYETGADGRVTHVHAGGPSIQYVEGCS